ncbi:MAG: glycosyltransferase family 4 protein [Lewinellaceae bacterium]|nr:glycosyltransferase family 4 protein [Lewinellaceae bacterium]
MRIAVNTRFLLPDKLEGLGWYTHALLRRMVVSHPEDQFFFFFDRPFDPAYVYAENVTPIVLFPPARHPVLWYAWFEWAVPRALRRCKADVFFSPDCYLSLASPVPTVMTVHDLIPLQHPGQVPWWSRDYYRYFIPRYIRRANRVVAVSEFTRKAVLDGITGADPAKITTVYNGCRSIFRPLPEAEKQRVRDAFSGGAAYFFYSGAIHPRKNIHRLIHAFDAFKKRTGAPVKLLLAGRFAWETGPVQNAFQRATFKQDIHFLGYIGEQDLARLTAGALALVNVSLSEGFGLPLVEAMYCDTPVLCSNTSALPEVAGDAALLVDPLSEQAISAALEKLFSDESLRAHLVAQGRERRNLFDWDQAAEQVYRQLKLARNSSYGFKP